MKRLSVISLLVITASAPACKGSGDKGEEEKATAPKASPEKQTKEESSATTGAAATAMTAQGRALAAAAAATNAQNLAHTAKQIQALAAMHAAGGKRLGPVVNWRKLEPLLGDQLAGFSARRPVKGSTGGMAAMQVTTAKRRYEKGEQRLMVTIVDSSLMPNLRAGFLMAQNITRDSSDGLQKGVKLAGHPGMLKWRKSSRRGTVTVLVGGRFMVTFKLRPSDTADEVSGAAKAFDFATLAKLIPQPAPAAKP